MGDDDQALRIAPAQLRSGVCADGNAVMPAPERHANLAPGSAAPPLARRLRAQPARSQASEWTRTNAGERSDAERG